MDIERYQSGTSFPGDNLKKIDYVIKYKEKDDDVKERTMFREAFIQKLNEKDFNIYTLKSDKQNVEYILLNCPDWRLLEEARKLVNLNNLKIKFNTVNLG